VSDRELSHKLQRLSQQLGSYMERPQSPFPRRKANSQLNFINQLARTYFQDPDDIAMLNKLVHEENEFIVSVFDVYEADKDTENLVDSLFRILEKSKQMGLHLHSITASSFFNAQPWQ